MTFDWRIDVGNIVTIFLVVLGALGYVRRLEKKLDRIGIKVHYMWRWFKKEHGMNGGPDSSKPLDEDDTA
jgi:hypothetical protein